MWRVDPVAGACGADRAGAGAAEAEAPARLRLFFELLACPGNCATYDGLATACADRLWSSAGSLSSRSQNSVSVVDARMTLFQGMAGSDAARVG